MKKFKERMAERAGFTLVELIVVIAILGILAAVAVPAYTGYIEKAKEATDITTVSAVKTAAQAALATKGEVTEIVVTPGTTPTIKVTYTDLEGNSQTIADILADTSTIGNDFDLYFTESLAKFESDATTATWAANATSGEMEWTFA